jgi:hypothetical protein
MGCTAEIVLAGAWAHTIGVDEARHFVFVVPAMIGVEADGTTPRVERELPIDAIARQMREESCTFAEWLDDNRPAATVDCELRIDTAPEALLRAVSAAAAGGGGRVQVGFVFAAYGGVARLSEDVKALLPSTVLLLHDVPHADRTLPTALGGRRLRGFYPVCMVDDDCAVPLSEVPALSPSFAHLC